MAMWSMLGPRPVDVFYWESFGEIWMKDASTELPLAVEKGGKGLRVFGADFGILPDINQANNSHDILFTLNGTTAGVRVPHFDWIKHDREGLVFCDATSGIFAMPVDWSKIDVLTYSWQKVLGGEAAHGMLILSPRAVERLETYSPPWPVPKLFRMTKKGKVDLEIFKNSPINTPSMMCIEDYIDALKWVNSVGGVDKLIEISRANLSVIEGFVSTHSWAQFLCQDPANRSNTGVCLLIKDMDAAQVKKMTNLLSTEGIAHDIDSYKDAPAGLRIWCGSTVLKQDVEILMQWLEWAHDHILAGGN